MKKSKKLISLVVAAVMALGILVAPTAALAKDAPTIGKKEYAVFNIVTTTAKSKTIKMVGTTPAGKKRAKLTIVRYYKLDETFAPQFRKDNYTVVRICKGAFNKTRATKVILPTTVKKIDAAAFKGSKAKTITIKANLKPAKAAKMLKGSKAAKVTIKVPRKQVTAWQKAAKAGKLGMKGSKITIKAI